MTRKRMLHTEARALLRQAREWLDAAKYRCEPPSLTFYDAGDGHGKRHQDIAGGAGRRTRDQARPDYLENNVAKLADLSLYARGVAMQALKVHEMAEKRLKELEAGK